MFLNIITPCSRPENLHQISESINIPTENYRWVIVFDMDNFPDSKYIPDNCEIYLHRNPASTAGHSQRNYALELIKNEHVYMNDDDTLIYSELWGNIKDLTNDFITFDQLSSNGRIRLKGGDIRIGGIDSHNFIISRELINNTKWIIDRYDADGYFATECYSRCKSPLILNKPLSIYNQLR